MAAFSNPVAFFRELMAPSPELWLESHGIDPSSQAKVFSRGYTIDKLNSRTAKGFLVAFDAFLKTNKITGPLPGRVRLCITLQCQDESKELSKKCIKNLYKVLNRIGFCRLDLQLEGMMDRNCGTFLSQFERSPEILKFSKNEIDESSSTGLARLLQREPGIKRLELRVDSVTPLALTILGAALKTMTTLESLGLDKLTLTEDQLDTFEDTMRHARFGTVVFDSVHVKSDGEITADMKGRWERILSQNIYLQTCVITCDMTERTPDESQLVHPFVQALPSATALTRFDLAYAKLSPEERQLFVEGIKSNTTLESLTLYQLDGLSVGDMAQVLQNNSILKSMELTDLPSSAEQAHSLADSLHRNTTLTDLRLLDCNLMDDSMGAFASMLRVNTTLLSLSFFRNPIGAPGFLEAFRALTENNTLSSMAFSFWVDKQIVAAITSSPDFLPIINQLKQFNSAFAPILPAGLTEESFEAVPDEALHPSAKECLRFMARNAHNKKMRELTLLTALLQAR
ncbi:MAG: hypothetical protein K2P51_01500 [Rhabdochlamydiaceae bacterium]|nr:hypothetical protein [Rhabdochlamydiaceae bacterium]